LHPDNFHRSSQSFSITPNITKLESVKFESSLSDYVIEIKQVDNDFVIGYSDSIPYGSTHDLVGHLGVSHSGKALGILDAGVPHYSIGGLHNSGTHENIITFCGNLIGTGGIGNMFEINKSWRPYLDNRPLRGISLFVYPQLLSSKGRPPIWLIPQRRGDLSDAYSEGDVATLTTSEN
jgi:hypothetical protein